MLLSIAVFYNGIIHINSIRNTIPCIEMCTIPDFIYVAAAENHLAALDSFGLVERLHIINALKNHIFV